MEYIHVRNIEKYNPGYKDREGSWGRIYFRMVHGDPDCEMIQNEVDWGRLIKLILLELEAKKPVPNDARYLSSKNFDLQKRPMSLTLQMLHNFIEVVTDSVTTSVPREEKRREEKKENSCVTEHSFNLVWKKYPRRIGRKAALRHYLASVKTPEDEVLLQTALGNYLKSKTVHDGYIQHGSTWFNNWRDYVEGDNGTGGSVHQVVRGGRPAGSARSPERQALLDKTRAEVLAEFPILAHASRSADLATEIRRRVAAVDGGAKANGGATVPDGDRTAGRCAVGAPPEGNTDNRGPAGAGENVALDADSVCGGEEGEGVLLQSGNESESAGGTVD